MTHLVQHLLGKRQKILKSSDLKGPIKIWIFSAELHSLTIKNSNITNGIYATSTDLTVHDFEMCSLKINIKC